MSNIKFLPFAVLALTQSIALAQQVPSAGSQLRQIPPAPAPQQEPPLSSKQERSALDFLLGE